MFFVLLRITYFSGLLLFLFDILLIISRLTLIFILVFIFNMYLLHNFILDSFNVRRAFEKNVIECRLINYGCLMKYKTKMKIIYIYIYIYMEVPVV